MTFMITVFPCTDVRFTLTEMGERDPRLVTSADNTVGEGMLNFTGDTATTSVEVFTIVS